mgnify:FL=1
MKIGCEDLNLNSPKNHPIFVLEIHPYATSIRYNFPIRFGHTILMQRSYRCRNNLFGELES